MFADAQAVRDSRLIQVHKDGGKREMVEDEDHCADLRTQKAEPHREKKFPAVQRSCFRGFTVALVVLYVLILTGMITRYVLLTLEKEQLQTRYNSLKNNYSLLQDMFTDIPDILRRNATALHDVSNSSRGEKLFQMCPKWKTIHLQDGWVGIGFHCYFKSEEMKNWTESRTDCQSKGADLLIINAREEQEFVRSFGKSGAFWIGLQAVTTNHWGEQWKWVDNSAPTYLTWQKEVSVTAIKGAKVYIDLDGNWNHVNNGSKHWICEKPMN